MNATTYAGSSSQAVELFKLALTRNFGSVMAAWWRVLDRSGSGYVHRAKFVRECRRLRFNCDAPAVFEALARGSDGISLRDLDPQSARLIGEFAEFIRSEVGSVDEALSRGRFRRPGSGAASAGIQYKDFMHLCLGLGFQCANFRKLFECLDCAGVGSLSPEQLAFLDDWEVAEPSEPPPTQNEMLVKALECCSPLDAICGIVELRADPNILPPSRRTAGSPALIQAAERGDEAHVRSLLRCRADPLQLDPYGNTALHKASARPSGRTDPAVLVETLFIAHADLDAASSDGTTPLLVACSAGHLEVIAALCRLRADPNLRDASARSPLWFAVYRDCATTCLLLLRSMVDPCRHDRKSSSPIRYAYENGRHDILTLMQQHLQANCALLLPPTLEALHALALARDDQAEDASRKAQEMVSSYLNLGNVDPMPLSLTVNVWRSRLPGGVCVWPEAEWWDMDAWPASPWRLSDEAHRRRRFEADWRLTTKKVRFGAQSSSDPVCCCIDE